MRDTKASLKWITTILNELNIPFQIAGGLAAIAYGATRELWDIDIDVPEEKFELIKEKVGAFVITEPTHFKDEHWDLWLMTLNHQGQEIDLSGAHQTKIFDHATQQWHLLMTDFSKSVTMKLFGIEVPVIPKEDLLAYKKILARPVDLADITELSGKLI